jgi:hypothetical protein
MDFTGTTTLAEIASANPVLTRELVRLELDDVGGGKRSLEEACRQQGREIQAVITEWASQPIAPEPGSAQAHQGVSDRHQS